MFEGMKDLTTTDFIVVAVACVVTWFIARYIKRKNEQDK